MLVLTLPRFMSKNIPRKYWRWKGTETTHYKLLHSLIPIQKCDIMAENWTFAKGISQLKWEDKKLDENEHRLTKAYRLFFCRSIKCSDRSIHWNQCRWRAQSKCEL